MLEVGAGAGFLLAEISARYPDAIVEGFELNDVAARAARTRGFHVTGGSVEALDPCTYDLVIALAVLEHVPSPTDFLTHLHRVLKPGGHLVLVQPTQDVESYDVLFVDHLHHFGTRHLAAYGERCVFVERLSQIAYECMPNFSLHVWATARVAFQWSWSGPPVRTTCATTAARIMQDMVTFDHTAAGLTAAGRPFAVFGLHEVFALVRAYASTPESRITCGLTESPDDPDLQTCPFPVLKPEECGQMAVQDVFLTMNKIYYPMASERLGRLGLTSHPVLS